MQFSEIHHLKEKELWLKLSQLRKELFSARIKLTQKSLSNPLSIRFLRRDIARIQTALSLRRRLLRAGVRPGVFFEEDDKASGDSKDVQLSFEDMQDTESRPPVKK